MTPGRLGLFDAFGVELEYMIVDRQTLGVRPIADRVLMAGARSAEPVSDAEVPETGIGWSNELVLHVIELKTVEPVPALAGLPARFADSVRRVNRILSSLGARLMPSAMHPLMDPARDMRLWPHDNAEIYAAFDRIFGCTGHGWSNLQSVHLNLPFRGDEEFGRLHAAVRLILPMLPALAASSPMMDGRVTGVADNRLAVYRTNA
ncbi:MAG TPA: glutamate-cysteine ligase family protein, partial [Phycisphaerales bacterium]|nr:glutamate-cysteine ligase family protein [Phycisphaerales bacterium]